VNIALFVALVLTALTLILLLVPDWGRLERIRRQARIEEAAGRAEARRKHDDEGGAA
jgi:hypothetical protein